ncbi:MAG: diacylglycerol kinase [Haliea sp.]|uniref:diacylglycerol kinase n=1 Tax=Haliea sp. TaxID=1932666 RepID=UPI000C5BE054|nr:diacylglycerol kinase [Haliea sp.]MBM68954.1 diacylglycerol kinase [Haliea sp.]|tara:strand:+ start:15768 stop:16145 length:378 start_codon:yes stop_codon:yes gene_type:complete
MSDYNPETLPRTGIARVLKAFEHSFRGLRHAFRHEVAIRQECVVLCVGAVIVFLSQVSVLEAGLLLASLLLWIVVELLNSAIEAVVDRIGLEYHPLSGAAKDMGSAAVLICGIAVGLLWSVILLF